MPAPPLVAPSWRPACAVLIAVAIAVVAAFGVALHNRQTATAFDNWAARPLFAHIGPRGASILLGSSASGVTVGGLALVAVAGVLLRRWPIVALATVGPTIAVLLTEYVLKPVVHRQINADLPGGAYPSGHETGLVSLIVVLLVLLPRARPSRRTATLVVILLVLWAGLGAIGLVRGHYHFPTDTIGGIGVAVACVLGVALLTDGISTLSARGRSSDAAQLTWRS